MRASTRFFEVDVFVEVLGRPEVYKLHGIIGAADTIDAPEALNDPDGVPVDVIVDEKVAVLEILTFGNAISRYDQIDLVMLRHGRYFAPGFGPGREVREDLIKSALTKSSARISPAAHKGRVNPEILSGPPDQRLI